MTLLLCGSLVISEGEPYQLQHSGEKVLHLTMEAQLSNTVGAGVREPVLKL